ncbi:hypothetical protein R0J90_03495 [Micrococcus sp. SIMBA_144]
MPGDLAVRFTVTQGVVGGPVCAGPGGAWARRGRLNFRWRCRAFVGRALGSGSITSSSATCGGSPTS